MQALEQEVERIGLRIDPDIARAEALLDDFARLWEFDEKPGERQKPLAQLFDRVKSGSDGGQTQTLHTPEIEVRLPPLSGVQR